MIASRNLRTTTAALPRFSVAALVMVGVLCVLVAGMVGIAAWSIAADGVGRGDVVAAQRAGYERGFDEGRVEGVASGRQEGREQGLQRGRRAGYRDGFARGGQVGYRRGHTVGYQEGYAAGQAAPRPKQQAGTGTKP